jgi:hypothetical protein
MPGRSSRRSSTSSSSSPSSISPPSSKRSKSSPSYSHSSPKSPISISNISQTKSVEIKQPGFFSNVLQGFGLGTGQAIAHNIFRSNTNTNTQEKSKSNNEDFSKEYIQCMKESNNDKEACKQYL